MDIILKYFRGLEPKQKERIERLKDLYLEWNSKINVISRKDMDNFYERHVLHSMAINHFITFAPGSRIIDVGTGGGFPGIPLAIMLPEVEFTLLDSIAKKIKVVEAVAEALELKNVKTINMRSEQHKEQYDFIVNRAVAAMPVFINQTRHLVTRQQRNSISNGAICLKGGNLEEEMKSFRNIATEVKLSEYYSEDFFHTKCLIHIPL